MNKYLYVVFLGGKLSKNRLGEDHETVLVIAKNESEAKLKAKSKWQGISNYGLHIDAIQKIETIDNHKIIIEEIKNKSSLNNFIK